MTWLVVVTVVVVVVGPTTTVNGCELALFRVGSSRKCATYSFEPRVREIGSIGTSAWPFTSWISSLTTTLPLPTELDAHLAGRLARRRAP